MSTVWLGPALLLTYYAVVQSECPTQPPSHPHNLAADVVFSHIGFCRTQLLQQQS
jgi:hypothetical protein